MLVVCVATPSDTHVGDIGTPLFESETSREIPGSEMVLLEESTGANSLDGLVHWVTTKTFLPGVGSREGPSTPSSYPRLSSLGFRLRTTDR